MAFLVFRDKIETRENKKKRLDFFVRMGMFAVVHYVDLLERDFLSLDIMLRWETWHYV